MHSSFSRNILEHFTLTWCMLVTDEGSSAFPSSCTVSGESSVSVGVMNSLSSKNLPGVAVKFCTESKIGCQK